jgi:hypothetical protein
MMKLIGLDLQHGQKYRFRFVRRSAFVRGPLLTTRVMGGDLEQSLDTAFRGIDLVRLGSLGCGD